MKQIGPWSFAALYLAVALPCEAMTFREAGNGGNCDGCGWFVGEGEITQDTPPAFEQFMSDKNYHPTIYLNSPGGNLVAGLKLGALIRSKGLSTGVGRSVPDPAVAGSPLRREQISPGHCVSACAYAFLGSVSREAKAGEVGVHQFFNEAAITNPSGKLFSGFDLSSDQFLSALVIDHVVRMGADARIVSIASTTTPGDMHFFNAEEMDALKVNWDPSLFQPWAIEPYAQGVVAFAKSQDQTQTATLFCRKDKAPRLLITDPKFGQASDLQAAIDALDDGFEAFGVKLPKENASVKMVSGAPALEIRFGGLDATRIGTFTVTADTPRFAASYFYHTFGEKNAAATFRIAFRNCI